MAEISDELLVSLLNEAGNEGWDDVKSALTELQRRRAEARQEPTDYSNLLSVITDIRERSGVGSKPMLSELAGAIAERIAEPKVGDEVVFCPQCGWNSAMDGESSQPAGAVTEAMVEKAETAFNQVINNPQMVSCEKCAGKGYHHGFGEDGADPDWCLECGGNQYNVVPGEERRAMRAALEAAFAARPTAEPVAVKGLDSALRAAEAYIDEYEWDDGESHHVPNEVERLLLIDMVNGLFSDDNFVACLRATPAPGLVEALTDEQLRWIAESKDTGACRARIRAAFSRTETRGAKE